MGHLTCHHHPHNWLACVPSTLCALGQHIASAFSVHKPPQRVSASSAEGEHKPPPQESTLISAVSSTLQDWKKAHNLEHFRALPREKKKKTGGFQHLAWFCGIERRDTILKLLPTRENKKIGADTSIENVTKRNHFPKHRPF